MSGIYTLQDLRSSAPEHLRDASDEQLVVEYSNSIGRDAREIAPYFGIKTGADSSAFGAGVSAGVDSVQGLGISAAAGLADLVGADSARDALNRAAEAQDYEAYLSGKPELERIEDQETIGDYASWAAYQLGRQVPIMGAITAAQAIPGLGQAATATGLSRGLAAMPRMLGGAGRSIPAGRMAAFADDAAMVGPRTLAGAESFQQAAATNLLDRAAMAQGEALAKSTIAGSTLGFGSLYQASGEDGEYNPVEALALAPLYGLAEAAVPAALTGAARLKTGGYLGNRLDRALKGAAVGSITEAGTEATQTAMEIALNQTLTPEERRSQFINAIAAGALVGGGMGAAGGVIQRKVEQPAPTGETETETTGETNLLAAPSTGVMESVELDLGRAPVLTGADAIDETGSPDTGLRETAPTTPVAEGDTTAEGQMALDLDGTQAANRVQPEIPFSANDLLQNQAFVDFTDSLLQQAGGKLDRGQTQALQREKARLEADIAALGQTATQAAAKRKGKKLTESEKLMLKQQKRMQEHLDAINQKLDANDRSAAASSDMERLRQGILMLRDEQTPPAPIAAVLQRAGLIPMESVEEAVVAQQEAAPVQETATQVEDLVTEQDVAQAAQQDGVAQAEAELALDGPSTVTQDKATYDPETNTLNAEVFSIEADPKGSITLPQNVLFGIVEASRSGKDMPTIVVRDTKNKFNVDKEATAKYVGKIREVFDKHREIVQLGRIVSNQGRNLSHGKTEGESRLPDYLKVQGFANLRQKLAMKIEEFVDIAGGAQNVEALVALTKKRNETSPKDTTLSLKDGRRVPTSARTETMKDDVLFSSMWKDYKNGELQAADVVRQGPIRGNNEQVKEGKIKLVEYAKDGLAGLLEMFSQGKGVSSPYVKALANEIRAAIKKMEGAKNPVTIEFIKRKDGGNPSYDPTNNKITLYEDSSEAEILHEALHAATTYWVYNNPNHPLVKDLLVQVRDLIAFEANGGVEQSKLAPEHQKVAGKVIGKIRALQEGGRPLDAALELIAYGTTLRELRQLMKGIGANPQPETRSFLEKLNYVWQGIIEVMKKVLGVTNTAANNVLDSTMALLHEAQVNPASKVESNTLYMSVTDIYGTDSGPVDAAGAPVSLYEGREGRNAINNHFLSTEPLFKAIGWNKAEDAVKTQMKAIAKHVRENMPGLAKFVSNFNAFFNVPPSLRDVFIRWKEDRNTNYMILERMAEFIETGSQQDVLAVMEYLDAKSSGDTNVAATALLELQKGAALKQEADIVWEAIKKYVDVLPDTEKAYFENNTFSEFLIYASNEASVTSHAVGMQNLSDKIKQNALKFSDTDFAAIEPLVNADPNGGLLDGDVYYEVRVKSNINGKTYSSLVSKSLYDSRGGDTFVQAYHTDGNAITNTKREYKLHKFSKDEYVFHTGRVDYKDAFDQKKATELANAMRNTVGGLANYYAGYNFLNSLNNYNDPNNTIIYDDVQSARDDGITVDIADTNQDSAGVRSAMRTPGSWVELKGTKWGPLEGKVVQGPIWTAMRDMSNREPLVKFAGYNPALRWFKKSKTIYNPGTHITNTASNVTLAMMHDIQFSNIRDAAKLFRDYELNPGKLSSSELKLMEEFMTSGAMLGNYSSAEVKNVMYEAVSKGLLPENDTSVAGRVSAFLNMEAEKDKLAQQLVRRGKKLDNIATELYAAEDNIFRLAAFMKYAREAELQAQREGVAIPRTEQLRTAGRRARQAFLDYDIDAPFVKAMRQSFFPFISWPYAIMPVLGRIAVEKPWQIANVFAAYTILDMFTAALAGDDDEMREKGPKQLDERMFGIGPRMHIRIPFLGDDNNPVYYKLGDYMPLASTAKGLPNGFMGFDWWPAGLTPGGPFINMIGGIALGVDPFTGKKLHEVTDTDIDKVFTSMKFAYDQFTPSALRSSNWSKAFDAAQGNVGVTGRPVDVTNLIIARIGGLKAVSYNDTEEAALREIRYGQEYKAYRSAMARLQRGQERAGAPDLDGVREELMDLESRLVEKYKEIYKLED